MKFFQHTLLDLTELAKDLKRVKISSQLRFLEKMSFIKRVDYPKRAFITNKGMASRLAMEARTL